MSKNNFNFMKKVLSILFASLILFSCGKKKEEIPVEELEEETEETVSAETEKEEVYSGPDYSEDIYFEKNAFDTDDDNPIKTRWVYVKDLDTGNPNIFAYKTNIKLSIKPYIKLKTFGIQRRGSDYFYFVLLPQYMWQDAQSRYGYINVDFASVDPDCFLWKYFSKYDLSDYFFRRQYRSVEKKYDPVFLYDFKDDGKFRCCVEDKGVGAFGTWQEIKGDYLLIRTFAHEEFDGDDNSNSNNVQVDYKVTDIGPSVIKLQTKEFETTLYRNFDLYYYKTHPEYYNSYNEPYIYYYDFPEVFYYTYRFSEGDPFRGYEDIRKEFIESGIFIDNEYYLEYFNKYWDGIINEIFHKDEPKKEEISTPDDNAEQTEMDSFDAFWESL